jgi:hypothetical protein
MAYQTSDSGKYIIKKDNTHVLYVDTNKSPHPWLKLQAGNISKDGRVYYPFAYKHTLDLNDCLQFAESLSVGKIGYSGTKCILKEKGSSLAFGYTDSQNIAIATSRGNLLNETANPNTGESYAIVRHAVVEGKAPYHIAYVMFKDGSTNITLEADAGDADLTHPVFDMYSTTDVKKTFHRRYVDSFSPASTIVLTKR